jgi:hypothetical protein
MNKTMRAMNNLFNHTATGTQDLTASNYFLTSGYEAKISRSSQTGLLNPEIAYQMESGQLPDLRDLSHEVEDILTYNVAPYSALHFVPVLKGLKNLDKEQVKRFIKNPEQRHVLLSNEFFELVLNLWKPGRATDIHGHPGEGCLFKLLQGKLEELRYTPERSSKLLSMNSLRSGDMAYIDNSIAYHQVGNPYGSPAVSLHVYLK